METMGKLEKSAMQLEKKVVVAMENKQWPM